MKKRSLEYNYLIYPAIALILFSIIGCCPPPCLRSMDLGIKNKWTSPELISWFTQQRTGLKQVSAQARINIKNGLEDFSCDVILSFLDQGIGRIDGIGPFNSSLFHLIFNRDYFYIYLSNESKLYYSINRPENLKKILGIPVDLTDIFDLLSARLPSDIRPCIEKIKKGDPASICLEGIKKKGVCRAEVIIAQYPIVRSLTCPGWKKTGDIIIEYKDFFFADIYQFPKKIKILWTNKDALLIDIKSAKVNQEVSQTLFIPNEGWFQGEVIFLE